MTDAENRCMSLIDLPPELLHQIFVQCHPADLAALRRTHRALDNHLRNVPHLWKQLFHRFWDPYMPNARDAIITAALPSTKSVTRVTADVIESEKENNAATFDYGEQVRRRTWAEKQISRLRTRPIDTYANYNEALRTLLSVARSRACRSQHSRETADYLANLLTGASHIQNFRHLVYPRADVKQLREWQGKQLIEQQGKQAIQLHAQRRKDEKRARASSSASVTPTKVKRSRTSSACGGVGGSSSAALQDAWHEQEYALRLSSPVRRRSARVQLHAYPVELHHLLYDKRTQDLITLDDGTGVANLEDLDLLDEQAAAELHVLHGIHPGFRDKSLTNSTPGTSRASAPLELAIEESDDEDPDFVDAGTPTDPHFTDMEDDLDESEEEDVDDNVFRFFVDQLDLRRHYREPALGTDLGHETSTRLRGRARETVYDTARFGPENSYGPLRAWRERYVALDGAGFQTVEEAMDDGSEAGSDADTVVLELVDEEGDTDRSSVGDRSDGEIVDEDDLQPDAVAADEDGGDHSSSDGDFDGGSDGESEMSNLLWELREMAIAHSRGLVPYHESKRLKSSSAPALQRQSAGIDIWRSDKRVDWTIVEAIMVVMYCNIRHAVLSHGWGLSFRLPRPNRSSQNGQEQAHVDNVSPQAAGAWRDMVGLPFGWSHSRGTHDDRTRVDEVKPYDWAGVESTWIGTYAFLDWSKWASFNARDPISRGFPDPKQESSETDVTPPMVDTANTPSLEGEREALGDCLELRMELLPLAQQRPRNEQERLLSYLEGNDVECIDVDTLEEREAGLSSCQTMRQAGQYPPLRFRGHTRTYLDDGPPVPRGELYGTVRPIYAEGDGKVQRAVVALHWDITHRYDGEDAWSLSGIQAGPPGTRAPIYGIWGAAARRDNLSPCGPFTYYKTSERPWRETEAEARQ